jgi:hypothetical protein
MTSTINVHKVSYETKEMTIEWVKTLKTVRLVSIDDVGYKFLTLQYENNTEETICIHESRCDEWNRFILVANQLIPSTYFTHGWARSVTKLTWKEVITMNGVNYRTFVAERNFIQNKNLYIKEGDEQFKSIEPFICRFPIIQEDNCIKLDVSHLNHKLDALRILGTAFIPEGAKINKPTPHRHLTIIEGIPSEKYDEVVELVKNWDIKFDDIQLRGVKLHGKEDVCIVEYESKRLEELFCHLHQKYNDTFKGLYSPYIVLFSFKASC